MEGVPSLQKLIRGLPLPLPLVLLVLRGNLLLEHVSMVQYGAIQCSGPGDTALITHRWRSLPVFGLVLIIASQVLCVWAISPKTIRESDQNKELSNSSSGFHGGYPYRIAA